jgi:hypothetical protein
MLLKEGDSYRFLFYRFLDIDGEDFWVVMAPNDKKYLIEAKHYTPYLFQEGNYYTCKVDKVNCTGKVTLEPQHPHYKENQVYPFRIITQKILKNSWGEDESFITVKDIFGREAVVSLPDHLTYSKLEEIDLKVDKIRKGELILSVPVFTGNYSHLKEGEIYSFVILSLTTIGQQREFFVLKDEQNALHYLRKKYYEDYGFQKGDLIRGLIIHPPERGKYYLEPLYPGYELGREYHFTFVREDKILRKDGTYREIFIVLDKHGKECILTYDASNKPALERGKVKAKVHQFIRGKLFLQIKTIDSQLLDSFVI